jgi:hypothetical protein
LAKRRAGGSAVGRSGRPARRKAWNNRASHPPSFREGDITEARFPRIKRGFTGKRGGGSVADRAKRAAREFFK